MALQPGTLGCTHIAAPAHSLGRGNKEVGRSREQDYGSATGNAKQCAKSAGLPAFQAAVNDIAASMLIQAIVIA